MIISLSIQNFIKYCQNFCQIRYGPANVKMTGKFINYFLQTRIYNLCKKQSENIIVGATVSDFGLPWDLLAEIDFLV